MEPNNYDIIIEKNLIKIKKLIQQYIKKWIESPLNSLKVTAEWKTEFESI